MNRITVTQETLTDGSKVYNIAISEMALHACSEQDAITLADTLKTLIDVKTVDPVAIKFDY
jgi:hypothetical protein